MNDMRDGTDFHFDVSLSVLNHLGRNLYRSLSTILGEAISNSWDADASNVWISIDRANGGFIIKDDGLGMDKSDFQDKFLRIGYSKRKFGTTSARGRPLIGRKGIGKLALLSCAQTLTIVSRKADHDYVGGTIDNRDLDSAIKDDILPSKYTLRVPRFDALGRGLVDFPYGTLLVFEGLNNGIKNSVGFLKKTIALYFRFSLLDPEFRIFVDGDEISDRHLSDLADNTQFLWVVGQRADPFVSRLREAFQNSPQDHNEKSLNIAEATGFIASAKKPTNLKISDTGERVGVDLFVNGRLRERDILKHIPTARIVESYLYGQLHYDGLDDDIDRFTSSREGIVADDEKFKKFLALFRPLLAEIIEDWDKWRVQQNNNGDPDNDRLTSKARASFGLYAAVASDFSAVKPQAHKTKVKSWVEALSADAAFNFTSYAECFVAENLIRKYAQDRKIRLSKEATGDAAKWRTREAEAKEKGNISIIVRRETGDLYYLGMSELANLVDKGGLDLQKAHLSRDANEYKPMRDAVAHTGLLTDEAKKKLTAVYDNIKARIVALLSA